MAKLRHRRPFGVKIQENAVARFAEFATGSPRWLIGLDPGHSSLGVAVKVAVWPTGRLHVCTEAITRHRGADVTLRAVNRDPHPPVIEVATEAAAWAVPAGHRTSLASILSREGYTLHRVTGPIKGRIDLLADALSSNATRVRVTIEPHCDYLLRALSQYAYKLPRDGVALHATPGFAHGFDAVTYALAGAVKLGWAGPARRSGGSCEKPALSDSDPR